MQIKITMRCHFTLTRPAKIKNSDNKCKQERGTLSIIQMCLQVQSKFKTPR